MPAAVFLAAFFLCENWPVWTVHSKYARELAALSVVLPYLPYLFFAAGVMLGWRFHQTGMVLCAWLLGLSYLAMGSAGCMPGTGCRKILTSLVFIELLIFSTWRWRQLPLKKTIFWLALILLQPVLLVITAHLLRDGTLSPDAVVTSPLLKQVGNFFSRPDLSFLFEFQPELTLFYIIGCIFLLGALQRQDVLLAGLLGALLALFIGLGPGKASLNVSAAFSVAGLILLLSCIEASFIMAYRDDLTGLPSRRALNQALAGLGAQYAIAMIDVDHFKRFNDTYGHKSGDQVLKLLAARLNRMSGGARPFRYGGEEFTAVFPGKTVEEALPHLEACRKRLAETPFIVRGKTRIRSTARHRGKAGKEKGRKQVEVTASFGVAEPTSRLKTPSQVLDAADKALYRAKKAGRNCVKT
jgi:diguanylate cyclase (GGDEF)-like protein